MQSESYDPGNTFLKTDNLDIFYKVPKGDDHEAILVSKKDGSVPQVVKWGLPRDEIGKPKAPAGDAAV